MRGFIKFKRYFSAFLAALMVVSMTACGDKKESETDEVSAVFHNGISIGGIDIGGLTETEAAEKIAGLADSELEIILWHDEDMWNVKFSDIDVKADFTSALDAAMEIGNVGTDDEKEADKAQLTESPVNISLSYSCDETLLKNKLEEINNEINEKEKFSMDIDKTAQRIIKNLAAGDLDPVTVIAGEKEDAEEEKTLIGSFSTSFSANDVNRNENLRVACEKINGTVLEPGDIFDMNEALGPQTSANGYKAAGVIENGKIVSAIAGGVCQVTTTIYNAAIFAELKIVERHNHSLMVGYVPLGRDAAVAGTYKNLRFQNDTDYNVYIETYIENNNIVCNIYGHEIHDSDRRIDFERVWVATIGKPAEKVTEDPNMYVGERQVTYSGKTGAKVDTYKLVYEGDKLVSREWFSSSTYIATADEVRVGTKPKENEEVPVIGAPETPSAPTVSAEPTTPATPATPTESTVPDEPAVNTPVEPSVPDTSATDVPDTPAPDDGGDIPAIGDGGENNIPDMVIGG